MRYTISEFIIALLLLFPLATFGQEVDARPLDRREHRGREGWARIIPTHLKVQYAGSMGFLSAGWGWDYGKQCRWESDMLIGYLPRFEGERGYMTFTLKQNYIPWSLYASDQFSFEPLYGGIYLNTIVGEEFWGQAPDRYPSGYYWFSTRMRVHLFAGCSATWHPRGEGWLKGMSLYFEVNTSDLYIVRKVDNDYLRASDIIGFSLGLKLQIF